MKTTIPWFFHDFPWSTMKFPWLFNALPPTSPFSSIFTTLSINVECSNKSMFVDHACILKSLKLETTSSQKTCCQTHKCPTASFLATGGFVKLFHKIPWFFHDYSFFFKFHDFSMHGMFLEFSRFSMISRACGNPDRSIARHNGINWTILINWLTLTATLSVDKR